MRDMTTALNNKAHEHYETIMAIRVRDLDVKYNLAYRTKEQVEEKERLEETLKN